MGIEMSFTLTVDSLRLSKLELNQIRAIKSEKFIFLSDFNNFLLIKKYSAFADRCCSHG